MGRIKAVLKNRHNKTFERNEHAIQKAILTLLGSYRGRLTARQVAKAARLSRQTVYNHHKDINCAIEEGEKAILEAFSVELALQSQKLCALIPDNNTRLFYAMLIFMANRRELFCLICADISNQRVLYRMVELLYPKLDIMWLPKGMPAPELGSERADMLVRMVVEVVSKWGAITNCNIRKANHYIRRLLQIAADAAKKRIA